MSAHESKDNDVMLNVHGPADSSVKTQYAGHYRAARYALMSALLTVVITSCGFFLGRLNGSTCADQTYYRTIDTASSCYHFEQMVLGSEESQQISVPSSNAVNDYQQRCMAEENNNQLCNELTDILRKSLVPGGLSAWCESGFPTTTIDLGVHDGNVTTRRHLFDWGSAMAGFGCTGAVINAAAGGTPTCGQACDSSCGTGGDGYVSG